MNQDHRLHSDRFPRASQYHPDWVIAGVSGGANSLWLTEWLTSALDLRPGMKVLDLGCGRACSSIFLAREFGVQVWAVDLWFNPSESLQRIQDAGCGDSVFPLRANARSLPFASGFFDAIVCIDTFPYYGSDDLYLMDLARFVKPGGTLAIAQAAVVREIEGELPAHLREWWDRSFWSFHSAEWWKRHWERTGVVTVELADSMPDGWQVWLDWHQTSYPDNTLEIETLKADAGRYLGYARVVGRRREDVTLTEPVESIPAEYSRQPLLRARSC